MEEGKKFIPKELNGTLRKNPFKKNEKHPDMIGVLMINGVLHDLAGWLKKTNSGNATYYSLRAKPAADDTPQNPKQDAIIDNKSASLFDKNNNAEPLKEDDLPF